MSAARLEQGQLTAAVDLEVGMRVAHAVDVADLSGEIEDDLATAHEIVHRAGLAHVGDVDAHAIFDAGDVEQVAAVVGNQRIDEQDVGAELGEASRQVAADEPKPASDHHAAAAIELGVAHADDGLPARLEVLPCGSRGVHHRPKHIDAGLERCAES